MKFQVANALVRSATAGAARRLAEAFADPEAAQGLVLSRILAGGRETAFGVAHGLARVRSLREFQNAVPPGDHESHAPFIARVMAGEKGVLTRDPVVMLEKTSGSTAASKFIPYTAGLLAEFQAANNAWLHDLLAGRPALRQGGSYWSISPAARDQERTAGGLPVGFADDTAYFSPLERVILGQLMVVPGEVAHLEGMEAVRYATLRHLLASPDLVLISVWNPTFLSLLVDAIPPLADRLVADLKDGIMNPPGGISKVVARPDRERAEQVAHALATKDYLAIWPRLALISCWTAASAARFVPAVQRRFPGVEIQGKGLLSTEGVVSIPLLDRPGAVLALTSHFLEFEPEAGGDLVLAHELAPGRQYRVLLTTGGGLYRYRTQDLVEVVGFENRAPLVDFVGKGEHISDLVGEKLNALHVARALESMGLGSGFAMLAPEEGPPPFYACFLEAPAASIAALEAALEAALTENHHYKYARDLGQLGPSRIRPVGPDAAGIYLKACEAWGRKAGNIKPTALHQATGWSARFNVT